jgi:biofilm PGA synthesis N-glycosyltransferase PgaC
MPNEAKYVIVTPARDEEEHISATIEAVASQTIRPIEWVIVNDGSTDKTARILEQYAGQFSWITVVHRSNRGFRKAGGGVVETFYEGLEALRVEGWDFVVKLDADLNFSPDYFEKCFERFNSEPLLGIGGGTIYHRLGGKMKLEATPRFHVRGATKIYRRACWQAIGGLLAAPGWDTIDEVKANMLGWKTYSFGELHLHHYRFTGSADGLVRDSVKHGVVCYISGYHPAFVAASCLYRLFRKPYVIGSFAILWGFFKSHFNDRARVSDPALIRYIREQQLRRLCGQQTIWK